MTFLERVYRAIESAPLAAALLIRSRWFTREIVTRRWFLHQQVAPLLC